MSVVSHAPRVLYQLPESDRQALVAAGSSRRYGHGEMIIMEGDNSAYVVVILDGRAIVSSVTDRGGRLVLAIRGDGDLVGDLAALDGQTRSATVTSLGTTAAIVVPGRAFHDFVREHPQTARVLMLSLGARLRDSDAERLALISLPVLQRLARLLVALARSDGVTHPRGTLIDLPLPQHELAASIGTTRESAAKALGVLRDGGLTVVESRRLVVVDLRLLDLLANRSSGSTQQL
jgi:CRP/FNR family cyclic AMP-dependent transcriptional regulator